MAFYQKLDATTKPTFGIGYDKIVLDTSAVASPWTWTFPSTPGSTGFVLTTDGAGNLSWVAPGAAGEQTPYYLGPTETFTVYPNKQVLFSREITVDGELNVDGDLIQVNGGGGGDGKDAIMPYYIEPGDTYEVPLYKQGLFAQEIEVDGELVVDGNLIQVDQVQDVMDSLMPYLIEAGERYRIPIKKQGLFAVTIEVDGELTVDGILVGV